MCHFELRFISSLGRQWKGSQRDTLLPGGCHAFDVRAVRPFDYFHAYHPNRRGRHVSTKSPKEGEHVTARVSTSAAWDLDPRENHCCVHIYTNEDHEYDRWHLKNTSRSQLSSSTIKAQVESALENYLGIFGKGDLS